MMRKLFAVALMAVGLLFAMAGCQKEGCTDSKASNYDPDAKKDNGTCVYTTPEPEPTPVIPTKEVTIDWNWDKLWAGELADADSVKKYTDMEDVKFVFLNLIDETHGSGSSRYPAWWFHATIDSLQQRFDVSNKVCGSGTIFVHGEGGAQWPDSLPNAGGMAASDSTKFANWGYQIKRYGAARISK